MLPRRHDEERVNGFFRRHPLVEGLVVVVGFLALGLVPVLYSKYNMRSADEWLCTIHEALDINGEADCPLSPFCK